MMSLFRRRLKISAPKIFLFLFLLAMVIKKGKRTFSIVSMSDKPGRDETFRSQQKLLNCLSNGHFQRPSLTPAPSEVKKLVDTVHEVWAFHGIPLNLMRPDGKCGNVTFDNHWARALCDPNSDTQCCYENHCANKNSDECTCHGCLDMRQPLHPEFGDYILNDKSCDIVDFNKRSACDILNRKNVSCIITIGDSLLRHLHEGFLIHLKEDEQYGALRNDVEEEIRQECSGYRQFTEKYCRNHVDFNSTVCGGKIQVLMAGNGYKADYAEDAIYTLKSMPQNTLIINSIGLQDDFKLRYILTKYVEPVVETYQSVRKRFREDRSRGATSDWPKYMWMSPHLPGLLKGVNYVNQGEQDVRYYDARMKDFFQSRDLLYFNTFNISRNVFSWDGTHYGQGFNMKLAQVLLSFVDAL